MDEPLTSQQQRAIARYSLLGHILHTAGQRGSITRAVDALTHTEVTLAAGEGARRLSRATVYRDLRKARDRGVWALMRPPRKDKGCIHVMTPEQIAAFVDLCHGSPDASAPVLIRTLENRGVVPPGQLRPSTVRRLRRQLGLAPAARRGRGGRAYRRFEVEGPMAMWQGDASPGIWVGSVRAQLYAWIDVFSRACVAARYYPNQRLPAFDDCLYRAIARFGVPASVHCDNGSPYVSGHFRRVCADLGIRLIHATPRAPAGKGRIERFLRTVQEQAETSARALVEEGTIQTLDDLNEYLQGWIDEYNTRVHSSTQRPPLEVLGTPKPYPDLRRLSEIFLWRDRRRVDRRGEVSLAGNRYSVPDDMVGTVVTVAYRPFDLREVYLEVNGTFLPAPPAVPVRHLEHPKLAPAAKTGRVGPADYLRGMHKKMAPEPALTPQARDTVTQALTAALGRELRTEEHDLITCYLARPGLCLGAELHTRLAAFVRRHGTGQHLSRYLDAIWGQGR
jgi:putative transposase